MSIYIYILTCLFPGKLSKNGESDGNCRIKMGTRNMSNGVDHHHDNQTPGYCYTWKCY